MPPYFDRRWRTSVDAMISVVGNQSFRFQLEYGVCDTGLSGLIIDLQLQNPHQKGRRV